MENKMMYDMCTKKSSQRNMLDTKILVTGGAGFIGSNLVKALLNRGHTVTVLDDFSVGRIENLSFGNENLEIIKGSVCNIDLVRKLMSRTDIVYHLAVKCLVACNEDPIIAHDTNVGGTFNICIAAYETGTKIVYVSSSEVYGTCKSSSPMDEGHTVEPQSIYGLSKLMGEEYVRHFNRYYGVPAVIVRPFNAYGPNHRNDQYSAVITSFIRRLDNGEYPTIEWTGEQSRDFTYVTDTVDGIVLLSDLENGEIVNIGSGSAVKIKDLALILMKIYNIDNTGNDIKGMENRLIFADKRPNDLFKLEADISLAMTYGYKPKVTLEEGLRQYIAWWKCGEYKKDNKRCENK